jgi:hypothetical protein
MSNRRRRVAHLALRAENLRREKSAPPCRRGRAIHAPGPADSRRRQIASSADGVLPSVRGARAVQPSGLQVTRGRPTLGGRTSVATPGEHVADPAACRWRSTVTFAVQAEPAPSSCWSRRRTPLGCRIDESRAGSAALRVWDCRLVPRRTGPRAGKSARTTGLTSRELVARQASHGVVSRETGVGVPAPECEHVALRGVVNAVRRRARGAAEHRLIRGRLTSSGPRAAGPPRCTEAQVCVWE